MSDFIQFIFLHIAVSEGRKGYIYGHIGRRIWSKTSESNKMAGDSQWRGSFRSLAAPALRWKSVAWFSSWFCSLRRRCISSGSSSQWIQMIKDGGPYRIPTLDYPWFESFVRFQSLISEWLRCIEFSLRYTGEETARWVTSLFLSSLSHVADTPTDDSPSTDCTNSIAF